MTCVHSVFEIAQVEISGRNYLLGTSTKMYHRLDATRFITNVR